MRRILVIVAGSIVLVGVVFLYRFRHPGDSPGKDLGLITQNPAPGQVRVTLHSLTTAGPIVTVIGEINYDPTRLQWQDCASDGQSAGKDLHVREAAPGTLRLVLAGSLTPLPANSEVAACVFAVIGKNRTPVTIRAHGEVADTTFADRPFDLTQTVAIDS